MVYAAEVAGTATTSFCPAATTHKEDSMAQNGKEDNEIEQLFQEGLFLEQHKKRVLYGCRGGMGR